MKEKEIEKKKLKNKKNCISLETKLEILRRFAGGEKATNISIAVGLPLSTVKTIKNRDGDKIREVEKNAIVSNPKFIIRTRTPIMVRMESLLSIWIESIIAQRIPLSKMVIQAKAKSLFEDLKTKTLASDDGEGCSSNETFEASNGWFERFKSRANLHNISLKGEAASADMPAAEKFIEKLKPLIHEGGYDSRQVFNVDETGLFWKRLPNKTYISKAESSAPGCKAIKNRLSLLLGGNANGDFKFKPFLIYQSENPRALKGLSKSQLPVHWRSNNKAWMTASMFQNWFETCALPEIKDYCAKQNLSFKALILVDNAPGHPVYLDNISDNVKVMFLPPNTTSIIQPMDQGVISTFKSYYLRRILKLLLSEIDGQEKSTMLEFWKKFNILKAVKIIADSWKEVKPSCMNGVWRKLWPECVHQKSSELCDETTAVIQDISRTALESNFEGMEAEDISEYFSFHHHELSNEELIQLESSVPNKEIDENLAKIEKPNLCSSKKISTALNLIDEAIDIFIKNDADSLRSFKVSHAINSSINCYKELYQMKRKEAEQETLDKYFTIKKNTAPEPNFDSSSDVD
jgi:hypothetical protein